MQLCTEQLEMGYAMHLYLKMIKNLVFESIKYSYISDILFSVYSDSKSFVVSTSTQALLVGIE